jgi:hypothetical protein
MRIVGVVCADDRWRTRYGTEHLRKSSVERRLFSYVWVCLGYLVLPTGSKRKKTIEASLASRC